MLPLRAVALPVIWGCFCVLREADWQLQVARSSSSLSPLLPHVGAVGCMAHPCGFGLRVARCRHRSGSEAQPQRGGFGSHSCPLPSRFSPCFDHRPALPLSRLFCRSCLTCLDLLLPHPQSSGSLSSGPTPPGSLPCCPGCRFLPLLSRRIHAGAVCLSLRVPVEISWGALNSVPVNRPRGPRGVGATSDPTFPHPFTWFPGPSFGGLHY